ncbi:MAG: DUF167 domain-containing protein [Alphaproteobacteria bacterium]|nr:DUF167 domain-containing protein [Alphaproteobacteria bacterium]
MSESLSGILTLTPTGLRLTVRAKPGQSRVRAIKVVDIGDGKRALEISVSAAAQEGKANKALIERLADECGVSKKQVEIKSGETGRLKIMEIRGDSQALLRKLAALLNE